MDSNSTSLGCNKQVNQIQSLLTSVIREYDDYIDSFEGQLTSPTTRRCVMYILVNKSVRLSSGKIASQVGHAVQKTTQRCLGTGKWISYIQGGMPKIVLKVSTEEEFVDILNHTKSIYKSYVVDEGRTQCKPDTVTAVGYDPLFDNEIPACFKKLSLY
jgi:peptidyl-tRNA hydrolase